jgi:hypothetical protein
MRPHPFPIGILCVGLSLALSTAVHAAIRTVDPGGGGDATTIAGGLALASAGDVVLVVPGTYREHYLQLKPSVTLQSQSGAAVTAIDAENLGDGLIGADNAVLRGFTITHAGPLHHCAVLCTDSSPSIFDNIFEDNFERDVSLLRSNAVLSGNEFHLTSNSDAVVALQSSPTIMHNTFLAAIHNGLQDAIYVFDNEPVASGVPLIEDNYIEGNVLFDYVRRSSTTECRRNLILHGAINVNESWPIAIHHNTIVKGQGVYLQNSSVVTFTNNIVVHTQYFAGIAMQNGGTSTLDCNNLWDNATNYEGLSPGPHDFSADPQFCDEPAGNYELSGASPCAPGQSPSTCGLVGTFPVTCQVTPARKSTWGQIKTLYR